MRKRFWPILTVAGGVIILSLGIFYVASRRQGDNQLFMSSKPRQGHWEIAGAGWDEGRRKIGIELSRREDVGPIRCSLRVKPGAAARKEPEFEVELKNVSDANATIHVHQFVLDNVTFLLRASDDAIVGSFCYVGLHSTMESKPPVILRPGESQSSPIYLSVLGDHGFQSLQPGVYSLEAVFHDKHIFNLPLPEFGMVARSNRVAIRVGDG